MNKKQIKQIFKNNNVQLGAGSLEVIEDELNRYVRILAVNCNNGNVKRLTPDLMWVALGRHEL
tara:strand:+ start:1012 stop:1200 length:189 start_codon:yes stop_codon:yes gene_type:complete